MYVCMRIYSGRRGYDLPLLDYAWLIQLINKRNSSPQNTVQSTSLNWNTPETTSSRTLPQYILDTVGLE